MAELIDVLEEALPSRYTVQRQLGVGGQGAVFLCLRGGRSVAVKLFSSWDLERLKREIELLSKIDCPSLVRLLDFEFVEVLGHSVPMAVYEYVDGGDLRALVQDSGQVLSRSQLVEIGCQVGEAIEALWSLRVVHRDIKPDNIVQSCDGRYVLVDVGLAQHLDLKTITAAQAQPGTRGYRSPEQCGGRRKLTVHSDVFSFGVSLFEVAAKSHPWSRNEVLMRTVPPPRLRSLRPRFDDRLCGLVHRMVSRRPALRPCNPAQLFGEL